MTIWVLTTELPEVLWRAGSKFYYIYTSHRGVIIIIILFFCMNIILVYLSLLLHVSWHDTCMYILWFNINLGLFCAFRRKSLKYIGLSLRFQVVRYKLYYVISQHESEKLEWSLSFLFLLFHLKVARSCSYKVRVNPQPPALSDSPEYNFVNLLQEAQNNTILF